MPLPFALSSMGLRASRVVHTMLYPLLLSCCPSDLLLPGTPGRWEAMASVLLATSSRKQLR
jgi:hypothetical protein